MPSSSRYFRRTLSAALAAALVLAPFEAFAFSRVKDLVDVEGVRDNMLVGYGLVVGLNGSGDSLQQRAVHPAKPHHHAGASRRQYARPDDADEERRRRDGDGELAGVCGAGNAHRRFGQRARRCQKPPGRHLAGDAAVRRRRPDLWLGAGTGRHRRFLRPGAGFQRDPRRSHGGAHRQWRAGGARNRIQTCDRKHAAAVAAQSRPHDRDAGCGCHQPLSRAERRRGERSGEHSAECAAELFATAS